ncbi:C40 family peptidase [Nonomuraea sediminis]|uniref:C40 family peptidase n=1 Tax=Nonomuraea sediminis TaxID=2835864 RepID=UPI001BDBE38E|nr:C40 family peptidase [Nonomuraea sediminis]
MHIRAGLLVACLVVAVCPPAAADPAPSSRDVAKARATVRDRTKALSHASARLAVAQARLEDLAATAEQQVEAYNGELVKLAAAGKAYEQAKTRLVAADTALGQAREAVAAIAAQTYGGMDLTRPIVTMVSDVGDTEGFLHRASVLEELGDERARVLDRMRDAQVVSTIMREQAQTAYAAQQDASARAKKAKLAAQHAVETQTSETKQLLATKKKLQKKVDAARGEADRLAMRRAAALQAVPAGLPLSEGSAMGDVAANWALTQLGKPYVWAAAGPSSYDCSGLTMRAWEQAGVQLDHWTGTQWTSGPHVPLDQLRRGDLLFYGQVSSDPGTIHHVGIYVGRGLMVNAPQTGDVVRVASMWRRDLVGATRPS